VTSTPTSLSDREVTATTARLSAIKLSTSAVCSSADRRRLDEILNTRQQLHKCNKLSSSPERREGRRMWIESGPTNARRRELRCDECGAVFDGAPAEGSWADWHRASIAGWARTARTPERHVCPDC
jgi:hypothetical protein